MGYYHGGNSFISGPTHILCWFTYHIVTDSLHKFKIPLHIDNSTSNIFDLITFNLKVFLPAIWHKCDEVIC